MKVIPPALATTPDPATPPAPALTPDPHVIPIPVPLPVPLPEVLWNYIVALVQNLLPRELDILKSIVYGGLIESITSLGVVSSAAASGASTRKYT